MSSRPYRSALLYVCCSLMLGADWPQWLGPDRDGKSAEEGVASRWAARPDAASLKPMWKRAVGAGYAGVVVKEGTVFTAATADGHDKVIAMDAETGEVRWSSTIGGRYVDSMGYQGPRATPTIAGDKIVALNGSGALTVFEISTGTTVWTTDLVRDHGGTAPQWGYSASPFVEDGVIYVDTGAGNGNSLTALRLEDGLVLWRSGTDQAGYATPVRTELAGEDQLLFFGGSGIQGVRISDGTLLWSKSWRTSYGVNAATPLPVGSDRIFISSGYGKGGALLKVDDAGNVEPVWQTKQMKNKLSTSIRDRDRLYGFSESTLTALKLGNGEPIWTYKGFGLGTVLMVDKHLVVLSDQCELALIDPRGTKPKVVVPAQQVLDSDDCWTVPTLANGILWVRSPEHLAAFDLR